MTTKFIYTRTYTFTPDNGRNMFFELIERHGDKVSFRLRDKGFAMPIEADLQVDENIECCTFVCKGQNIDLYADQYISKGFQIPRQPNGQLMTEEQLREWRYTTREEALKDAHLYTAHNREALDASAECGCCCCERIFATADIEDWADAGTTAICPHCGTDAVIPNVKGIVKVSPTLLKTLNEKYF